MGNWHAPEEGNKERRVQQEKPAGGEGGAVARSTDGLSNKGLQGVVPGLTLQLKGMGGAVLDDTIARAIHSKRGTGESLDPSAAGTLGESMGHDFSDVNIHRDAESDHLNKQVQAEAFTTGKDIFFREGKYDPVSNEGQKLLAHELTHVVQQRDAPPASELRVSDPHEASEQQAHKVADSVTGPGASASAGASSSVGREEEEAATSLDRHAAAHGEDEESPYGQTTMHTSVEREESEEKEGEEAATMVAREEGQEEEKEEAATMVAREEGQEEEKEEAATMVAREEGQEEEKEEAATMVAREEGQEEEKEEGAATMVARDEAKEEETEEGAAAMVARDHSPEEEDPGAMGHAM